MAWVRGPPAPAGAIERPVRGRPAPAGGAWAATSLGSGAPPGALGPLRGLPSLQLAAQAPPAGAGSQHLGSRHPTPHVGNVGARPWCLVLVSDTPVHRLACRDSVHGVSDTCGHPNHGALPSMSAPPMPHPVIGGPARAVGVSPRRGWGVRDGQLERGQPPQGAEGAWWRARAERRGRPARPSPALDALRSEPTPPRPTTPPPAPPTHSAATPATAHNPAPYPPRQSRIACAPAGNPATPS